MLHYLKPPYMTLTGAFKLIFPTILFYIGSIATIYLFEKLSPSGPCTPGLGFMACLLFIPLAIALLLRNIYLTIVGDRKNGIVALLHAAILMTISLLGYYDLI